jgi:non-heme chloroperoxidase
VTCVEKRVGDIVRGWAIRFGLGAPPAAPPGTRLTLPCGERINFFDEGRGRPVVLVHGLPGSAYEWGRLPELLVAAGLRVVRYDRVGYGHSSRRMDDSGDPVRANVRELGELCDALDLASPLLLGWSYAGAIVLDLLGDHPDRACGVILLGSVGPRHEPFRLPARVVQGLIRLLAATGPGARVVARSLGKPMFNGSPPREWLHLTAPLLALPGTLRSMLDEARPFQTDGLRPDRLRVPALVIHGSQDASVRIEVGRDLAQRIPHSDLLEIEGGSHMLQMSDAPVLASAIAAFAARIVDR